MDGRAGEFPVKVAAENRVVTVLVAFGATWGMPLLFLISGMGVRYSLRSRDPGAFARERLLKGVDGWLWVVAILGFARDRSGRRSASPAPAPTATSGRARRLAAYANDAVLPFYVLHETVIVVVAYAVLSWPIGGGLQYCLIAVASLAATLLLYDLGVRRLPVTRLLFGLKPQPRGMV
jgi:hypothetical protein